MNTNLKQPLLVLTALLLLIICTSCQSAINRVLPQAIPTATATLDPAPDTTPTDPWDRYEAATIQSIIAEFKDEVEAVEIGNKSVYPYPSYKVKMVNLDECRDIPTDRLDLLSTWSASFKPDLKTALEQMYQHECKFSEGANEYWLPIEEQLLPYLRKESAKGEEVSLFVLWLGVNRTSKDIDWVFWITEFDAAKS